MASRNDQTASAAGHGPFHPDPPNVAGKGEKWVCFELHRSNESILTSFSTNPVLRLLNMTVPRSFTPKPFLLEPHLLEAPTSQIPSPRFPVKPTTTMFSVLMARRALSLPLLVHSLVPLLPTSTRDGVSLWMDRPATSSVIMESITASITDPGSRAWVPAFPRMLISLSASPRKLILVQLLSRAIYCEDVPVDSAGTRKLDNDFYRSYS